MRDLFFRLKKINGKFSCILKAKIKERKVVVVFILSDGKNYVMEDPMRVGQGRYLATTSPVHATRFTYKQAKSLVKRKGKHYAWLKGYQLINEVTGEKAESSLNYNGNGAVYVGENDIDIDHALIDNVVDEANSIIRLAAWDKETLQTHKNSLNAALSKYDSAISDINHAIQMYLEGNVTKPQAHKMAKLGYMIGELRVEHGKVKQCLRYVQVLQDAITYSYSVEKIKLELIRVQDVEYKGRTEYYDLALEILGKSNGGVR